MIEGKTKLPNFRNSKALTTLKLEEDLADNREVCRLYKELVYLNLLCSTSFSKIHACNVKNLSSVLSLAC
jgi:hypothetical protein